MNRVDYTGNNAVAGAIVGAAVGKIVDPLLGFSLDLSSKALSFFLSQSISDLNAFTIGSRATLKATQNIDSLYGYLGAITHYVRYLN